MTTFGVPLILGDRTADVANTTFDDIYDRLFFGVVGYTSPSSSQGGRTPMSPIASSPVSPSSPTARRAPAGPPRTIKVFELASRMRSGRDITGKPSIILDFAPPSAAGGVAGGTVLFVYQNVSMPMGSWLRAGSSAAKGRLERTFLCSDGEEYKWTYYGTSETEWACTTASGYRAAEYNLRVPEENYERMSGNTLTIYEAYSNIASELLAALVAVRYIKRYSGTLTA